MAWLENVQAKACEVDDSSRGEHFSVAREPAVNAKNDVVGEDAPHGAEYCAINTLLTGRGTAFCSRRRRSQRYRMRGDRVNWRRQLFLPCQGYPEGERYMGIRETIPIREQSVTVKVQWCNMKAPPLPASIAFLEQAVNLARKCGRIGSSLMEWYRYAARTRSYMQSLSFGHSGLLPSIGRRPPITEKV